MGDKKRLAMIINEEMELRWAGWLPRVLKSQAIVRAKTQDSSDGAQTGGHELKLRAQVGEKGAI